MTELRLLGLDIDGVLNDHTINYPLYDHNFMLVGTIPGDRVCKYKAGLLRAVLQSARSQGMPITVVGISSWFPGFKADRVAESLYEKTGIKVDIFSRDTGGGKGRCTAFLDIVHSMKPKYWCILDDGPYYANQLKHPFYIDKPYYDIGLHVIETHGRYGMGGFEHERLIEILGLSATSYSGKFSPLELELRFNQFLENFNVRKISE